MEACNLWKPVICYCFQICGGFIVFAAAISLTGTALLTGLTALLWSSVNHQERVCKSRTLSAHKLFSGYYKPGNHIQADLNDKQEVIEVHLGWYLTAADDKESLKIIVLALTYSNTLHTLCFGTEVHYTVTSCYLNQVWILFLILSYWCWFRLCEKCYFVWWNHTNLECGKRSEEVTKDLKKWEVLISV